MRCDYSDPVAERQILSSALAHPAEVAPIVAAIPGDAWWRPDHALIATVIRERVASHEPVDPETVLAIVLRRSPTDSHGQAVGRTMAGLLHDSPPPAAVDYYVDRLTDVTRVRKMQESITAATQALEEIADGRQGTESLAHITRSLSEAVRLASIDGSSDDVGKPLSVRELLDATDMTYDWVIPGLLERLERLILTAGEGIGKSYLLAQFALCAAGGIHPFTAQPSDVGPLRVLVFDTENTRKQTARRYGRVVGQVNTLVAEHELEPVDWTDQMRVVLRPESVDLSDPRELARLERSISQQCPDLVIAGPLYRLHKTDTRDEQAAKELTDLLDGLRVGHEFALLTEAHVPHDTQAGRRLAPIGSSLFRRWPEFGYGMQATKAEAGKEHPEAVQMIPWRGGRDARAWPRFLGYGFELPWLPRDPMVREAPPVDDEPGAWDR